MTLAWTKFQDFYLRLGFLKLIVVVLDKQRTSAANEQILRRLRSPLFEPAASQAPALFERTRGAWDAYSKKHDKGDFGKPTVAEALLVDAHHHSFLFAITKPTVYKILDWARDVGFVGRGNQITERGLLLRSLIPPDAVETFRSGDVDSWNPFVLDIREKAFLLNHLCEIDRVTPQLINALAEWSIGRPLDLRDAGRLVCRTFHDVLDDIEADVRASELPKYRTARELAATMAEEMGMPELLPAHHRRPSRLTPKKAIGQRRSKRKLTKNTDHQTVPRFEQLADLGFVEKRHQAEDLRRRWAWIPTKNCVQWRSAATGRILDATFRHQSFAGAAVASFHAESDADEVSDVREIATRVWAAYEAVGRPFGATPFETVALRAMLDAVADGLRLEMARVHDFMLSLKSSNVVPEHAHFSGGNGLDEMFIRLRGGFVGALPERFEG